MDSFVINYGATSLASKHAGINYRTGKRYKTSEEADREFLHLKIAKVCEKIDYLYKENSIIKRILQRKYQEERWSMVRKSIFGRLPVALTNIIRSFA